MDIAFLCPVENVNIFDLANKADAAYVAGRWSDARNRIDVREGKNYLHSFVAG